MRDATFDRGRTVRYLLWTFGLAYAAQLGAARLYNGVGATAGQAVIAATMFVPALGTLLAGGRLSDMGWKPRLRKNLPLYLAAWFMPLLLTAVGAALYFLAFPGHFDLSGAGLAAAGGAAALEQLEAQGISYPAYVLIGAAGSVTYAPLINGLLGLGEEIGWRGFLYPRLKARFGRRRGGLLGGFIWGAWHWPLIWLIGYEYGADYAGFPWVGMLLFCAYAIALGILHDWLYERSGSIWLPALLHGAINAAATLPLAVCLADTGSARLLGPAPNGLIAGLPFMAVALWLFVRDKDAPRAPAA